MSDEAKLVQDIRETVRKKYGFEPNLISHLVTSPQVAQTYLSGFGFLEQCSLTPLDLHVAALHVSVTNGCEYCATAHGAMSVKLGASLADVERIGNHQPATNPRLAAIGEAVRLLMEKRGHLSEDDLAHLGGLGINRRQVHEVIAVIALKTISNYINHIEKTELNPEFSKILEQAKAA